MKKFMKLISVLVCTAFILTGCSSDKDVISMASKPMTEQYILSSMFQMLLEEHTDLTVNLTQGVGGGTSNIAPGMESGEFDLYPEYTGTGWNEVLKESTLYTEDKFDKLQNGYGKMRMVWKGMIGFNNTYGIAVRKDIADEYNLSTYSDLAKISDQLVFGAEYDFFERNDGFDALCDTYGLTFKDTTDLDIGLKYEAMNQGKIDVMNIFTTDGQLSVSDVTVLKDDKNLYPSYSCGFVVSQAVLDTYPELEEVLAIFEGLVTDNEMATMNYQVESEGKEPEEVAKVFLTEKGLLK